MPFDGDEIATMHPWLLSARKPNGSDHMSWNAQHLATRDEHISCLSPPGTVVTHHTRNLKYKLEHWCVSVFPRSDTFNVMADFDLTEKPIRIYVNLATRPIVANHTIEWTDLYLDVVFVPGRSPRLCDRHELEFAVDRGLLSRQAAEDTCRRAAQIATSSASLFRPAGMQEYVNLITDDRIEGP